ncbi:hypothetical protein KM043_003362 [Ampulex compressa]|nr:hypothetical protein KM043_003362 [Ampulex compressa]
MKTEGERYFAGDGGQLEPPTKDAQLLPLRVFPIRPLRLLLSPPLDLAFLPSRHLDGSGNSKGNVKGRCAGRRNLAVQEKGTTGLQRRYEMRLSRELYLEIAKRSIALPA